MGVSWIVQRQEKFRQKLANGGLGVAGCLIFLGQALVVLMLVGIVWTALILAIMVGIILYFLPGAKAKDMSLADAPGRRLDERAPG